MNMIKQCISILNLKGELSYDQMLRVLQIIVAGGATPAQIAAIFSCIQVLGYTNDNLSAGFEFWKHKNAIKDDINISITTDNPLHIADALALRVAGFSVALTLTCTKADTILGHLGINVKQDRNSVLTDERLLISNYVEALSIRRAFAMVESDIGKLGLLEHIRCMASSVAGYNIHFIHSGVYQYSGHDTVVLNGGAVDKVPFEIPASKSEDSRDAAMETRDAIDTRSAPVSDYILKRYGKELKKDSTIKHYESSMECLAEYIDHSNSKIVA